jgi:hypothetical protein
VVMDTSRAKRRPTWQTAMIWLGAGMALAWLAAFFLDTGRGEARRQMVVDKAREIRDGAQGLVAEDSNRAAV